MPLYEINGKKPVIGKNTWVAPSADIIGDVTIGDNCYIGFKAVIRGDFGKISIGGQSLIEEGVVIHCASKVSIGNRVILGHQVMLHDAIVHDGSLIGMQSMICDFSKINSGAIVAEQSLVLRHQIIPSGKIYGGSPAREVGEVTPKHRERFDLGIEVYSELRAQYLQNFRRIDDEY